MDEKCTVPLKGQIASIQILMSANYTPKIRQDSEIKLLLNCKEQVILLLRIFYAKTDYMNNSSRLLNLFKDNYSLTTIYT